MADLEQRTVIVQTMYVDGVISLNRSMGWRVTSRTDSGAEMGELMSVLVLEGDPTELDRDIFFVPQTAGNEWSSSCAFDCDGNYFSAQGRESLAEAVKKKRDGTPKHCAVPLAQLDTIHKAFEAVPVPARKRDSDDEIPF